MDQPVKGMSEISLGSIHKNLLGGGGGIDEKLGGPQKKLEIKRGVFEKYVHSQGGYFK